MRYGQHRIPSGIRLEEHGKTDSLEQYFGELIEDA